MSNATQKIPQTDTIAGRLSPTQPIVAAPEVGDISTELGSGVDPARPFRHQIDERRKIQRWRVDKKASLYTVGANRACTIRDLSPRGAQIQLNNTPDCWTGSYVVLQVPGFGPVASEVRHIRNAKKCCGLIFLHDGNDQSKFADWLTQAQAPHA